MPRRPVFNTKSNLRNQKEIQRIKYQNGIKHCKRKKVIAALVGGATLTTQILASFMGYHPLFSIKEHILGGFVDLYSYKVYNGADREQMNLELDLAKLNGNQAEIYRLDSKLAQPSLIDEMHVELSSVKKKLYNMLK